jgi:hypothetical protein
MVGNDIDVVRTPGTTVCSWSFCFIIGSEKSMHWGPEGLVPLMSDSLGVIEGFVRL